MTLIQQTFDITSIPSYLEEGSYKIFLANKRYHELHIIRISVLVSYVQPLRQSDQFRMAGPQLHLLTLPCEIRRTIYGFYYPVAKQIKVTPGPFSGKTTRENFKTCRLSSEAIILMRVCRQINDEVTAILYGTNAFYMLFEPREPITFYLYRKSRPWLHGLRSSTKQMVKKLNVHVELPMDRSFIPRLISGVSVFPTLEIRIAQDWDTFGTAQRKSQYGEVMKNMREICDGVMKMRGSARTTWNDMGAFATRMEFYALNIIGTIDEVARQKGSDGRWTVSGDEWTQRKNRHGNHTRGSTLSW